MKLFSRWKAKRPANTTAPARAVELLTPVVPPGPTAFGMAVYDNTARQPVVWCPEPPPAPERIEVKPAGVVWR